VLLLNVLEVQKTCYIATSSKKNFSSDQWLDKVVTAQLGMIAVISESSWLSTVPFVDFEAMMIQTRDISSDYSRLLKFPNDVDLEIESRNNGFINTCLSTLFSEILLEMYCE